MPEETTSAPFDPAGYWERRLSDRFSLGSTGWSSLGEAFNRWSYAVRAVAFKRTVRGMLGDLSHARVLDVGSGTGFYLSQWERLGAREVAGSDLTSIAVERLQQRFPDRQIHKLDIGEQQLPSLGAPYDAVSAMDVLFHLVDNARYARALANLATLLKPNGLLIFTENSAIMRREGRHEIGRTNAEIKTALRRAGLGIIREKPVFFLMNTPVGSESRLLDKWWDTLCRGVRRHEAIGWGIGAALFPLEVALGRVFSTGPSTKIIAARRSAMSSSPGDAATV